MHYLEKELKTSLKFDSEVFSIIHSGILDGLWYWDLEKPEHEWFSDTFWQSFGLDAKQQSFSPSAWQSIVHPEDAALAQRLIAAHLEDPSQPYSQHLRFRHREGHWVHIHCTGQALLKEGKPYRMLGLHLDISQKEQSRTALNRQKELRELLLEISAQFIDIAEDSYEQLVDRTLARLGDFTGADRVYIFDYDAETGLTSNTFEWCGAGIEAQIANLQKVPLSYFPEWVEKHFKGESLFLPNIDALDPTKGKSKAVLQEQGIKSLLAVPIFLQERYLGFVGFDWVLDYTNFNPEEEQILRLFANMLGQWAWRMEQENELRSEQEVSAQIVEELAFPVLILSPQSRILRYNQSFSKLLGAQAGALSLGLPVQSLFLPRDEEKLKACLHQAFAQQQAFCPNLSLKFNEGEEIPVEIVVRGLKDTQSKPQRLLLSIQDARRDQAIQRKLAEQAILLEALRDQSPIYIIEFNEDWGILRVNPRMEELLNQVPQDAAGHFKGLAQKALGQSQTPPIVTYPQGEGKDLRHIEWHFSVSARRKMAFGTDVTQREQQKQAVAKQGANLRLAQSLAKLGSWEEDLLSGELYASPSLYRIYERSESQAFSWQARYEAIHPEDRAKVEQVRALALERQMEYYSVHSLLLGTKEKYVEERAIVEWDAAGVARSLYGFTQDITEARKQSLALKEGRQQLEEAAKMEGLRAGMYKLLNSNKPWPSMMKSLQKRLGQALGASRSAFYEISLDKNEAVAHAKPVNRWIASSYASEAPPLKPLRALAGEPWSRELERWIEEPVHYYDAKENSFLSSLLYTPDPERPISEIIVLTWHHKKEGLGALLLALETPAALSLVYQPLLAETSLQIGTAFREAFNQQEQALAMQRFETLAQLSSHYIYEYNFFERKTYYSDSLLKFLGLSQAPDQHLPLLEQRLHRKDQRRVLEGFQDYLKGSECKWTSNYRLRKSNNDYAIIKDEAILLRNEQGEPLRLIGRFTDSGDFMADQLLLEEAARFAAFGAWQLDLETMRLQHTEEINRIVDRPIGQSIQLGSTKTEIWNEVEQRWCLLAELVHSNLDQLEHFSNRSFKIRSEQGQLKWVRVRVKAEKNKQGINRYYGIIQDISAEEGYNQDLKRANYWLQESQRVAGVGHFVMDLQKRQWDASDYVYQLLTLPKDYPRTFEAWFRLIQPVYRERTREQLEKIIAESLPRFSVEYQVQSQKGDVYWLSVEGEVKFDGAKQAQYILGTLRDVTRERRYLENIENQNRHLREIAWRQSHTMRAPLTRILALLQQLEEDDKGEEWRESLAILLDSAEELDHELKDVVKKIEYTDTRLVKEGRDRASAKERLKVLVVDDDPVILKLHQRLVIKSGVAETSVAFRDGAELIQFLSTNSEENTHYLIFLDINMPQCDGWAVLDFLDSYSGKDQCVVVMLSSSTDKADMQRAYRYSRVYEYLEKPLSLRQLELLKGMGSLRRFYQKTI